MFLRKWWNQEERPASASGTLAVCAAWLGMGDRYSVMRLSVMLILGTVCTVASHKGATAIKGVLTTLDSWLWSGVAAGPNVRWWWVLLGRRALSNRSMRS